MKAILSTLIYSILFLLATNSFAAPVTFEFTGTIRNLQGEPSNIPKNNPLSPGDKFWGEYTFESTSTMTDGYISECFGCTYSEAIYHGAISSVSFFTENYTAKANGGGFDILTIDRIINGLPQQVSTYQMYASSGLSGTSWEPDPNFQLSAPTLYGFNLKSIALDLYINSFVLENVNLPTTPPDINLFDQKQIYLNYHHDNTDLGVSGNLESLTLKETMSSVPEPSSAILLFVGITILGLKRGR